MTFMQSRRRRSAPPAPGMTLIELMIALVLGLVVAGAASALFITNRQTYVASESLARVQENARTAFELMARDVREAAGNPCANDTKMANVLNDAPTYAWWTNWADGVVGYDGSMPFANAAFGTGATQRVAGTDAIELKSGVATGIVVVTKMPVASADIEVSMTTGLQNNDIILVCDYVQSSIFQLTELPAGSKLQHNSGNGTPGNCTKYLGSTDADVVECTNGAGALPHLYDENAVIAKLHASRWYVGCNGRVACDAPGGRSLYQSILRNNAGVLAADNNEITEGVEDMTLEYLIRDGASYQPAAAGTVWADVVAVRINLALTGQQKIGTDGKVLQRSLQHVVAIRNRAQ